MPKALRAELHEGFAGWLEERGGAESTFELDEILGYHLEQAHYFRLELAGTAAADDLAGRAAGQVAGRRNSCARSRRPPCGERSPAAWCRPASRRRPQATRGLADLALALARRGELERAQEVLRSAIEIARTVSSAAVEAHARLDLSRLRTR